MKKSIASYAGMALGLFISSNLAGLLSFGNYRTLLIFALVLFFVDIFLKPVINVICLPVNLLTLGLFSLVINTLMIYLANYLYDGLKLHGFAETFLAAVIIVVCRQVFKKVFAG